MFREPLLYWSQSHSSSVSFHGEGVIVRRKEKSGCAFLSSLSILLIASMIAVICYDKTKIRGRERERVLEKVFFNT